jgi:hypothetical protein
VCDTRQRRHRRRGRARLRTRAHEAVDAAHALRRAAAFHASGAAVLTPSGILAQSTARQRCAQRDVHNRPQRHLQDVRDGVVCGEAVLAGSRGGCTPRAHCLYPSSITRI